MVRLQQEGFDINSEVQKIKRSDDIGVGALVTFVGYVRDFKEDKSDTLTNRLYFFILSSNGFVWK